MKKKMFKKLCTAVKEGGEILSGKREPARTVQVQEPAMEPGLLEQRDRMKKYFRDTLTRWLAQEGHNESRIKFKISDTKGKLDIVVICDYFIGMSATSRIAVFSKVGIKYMHQDTKKCVGKVKLCTVSEYYNW